MPRPLSKPAVSTASRLRSEIEYLRELIAGLRRAGDPQQHDQWYLSMLQQALARKIAALDYIQERDPKSRRPSTDDDDLR